MKEWGIRARVLFLALTPSVLILVALVVYFTYQRIAEVDVALAERGKLVARRLAPETEFSIFAGDRSTLQRLVDAAAREVDVRMIRVDDAQGRELAYSGLPEPRADAQSTLRFTEPVLQTRLEVGDLTDPQPANTGPSILGRVTVTVTRETARREQQRLLLTGLALGLAGLAIAITLAIAIGNGVIRPIRRLAKAMVELGRGERVAPIATTGGGELGTLTQGFNRMAEHLQADARELERRIAMATRELQAQKETAEQATLAKSRFVAAASHDLRQPLHAIGLFASTLQRQAQGTNLQSVAVDLGKAVAAMERLFHSLLDISRLDAGTLRAESRAFELQHLFDQIYAEFADVAARKQLKFHVCRTRAVVESDELLLHRILSNLVANAIRYTHAGAVLVCCRGRDGSVQIDVRDSGIGIAPELHEKIFQEFYQIGATEGDRSSGLGLGLAIVARLARLLGTQVVVRSALRRGSMFSLRLPRGDANAVQARTEEPPTTAAPRLGLSVLVIDDDPLVLAGNRALLEELGCVVTTVADRRQAEIAVAANTGKAILVLCDMWLADGRNGIDLLLHLAALPDAHVSSILISGDTRPETLAAASAAGYPLLHKPVSPAKLRAVVMNFAEKVRKMAAHGAE